MRRMRHRMLLVMLLLALLAVAPAGVRAESGDDGKVVFAKDFTLKAGESLRGDLAVFGGGATLEAGSVLDGDVLLMGGNLLAAGRVLGDIVLVGGGARLTSTARIDGDVMVVGGNLDRDEGASVRGRISEGFSLGFMPRFSALTTPSLWRPWWGGMRSGWAVAASGLRSLAMAIVLALLSLLILSLWPGPTQRVASTIWRSPGASVGMGILTLLIVPGVMVLLTLLLVTACLVPLIAVAAAISFFFGWTALGLQVGRSLLHALGAKDPAIVWQGSLGVLVISLIGALPCLGWLVWVFGGAFGLGAVVLTRFGSQGYAGGSALPPSEPAGPTLRPSGTDEVEPAPGPEHAPFEPEEVFKDAADLGGVAEMAAAEPSESGEPQAGLLPAEPHQAPEARLGESGESPEAVSVGDDLERIHGIGPVFAARLRKSGIRTFSQLADRDPDALAAIVELFPDRVRQDDWIGQARRLAAES